VWPPSHECHTQLTSCSHASRRRRSKALQARSPRPPRGSRRGRWEVWMSSLRSAAAHLVRLLAAAQPSAVAADAAADIATELAVTANACRAAAARFAARAGDATARRRGFAAAQDMLANVAGMAMGEARDALRTVEMLESCPGTRDALLVGD